MRTEEEKTKELTEEEKEALEEEKEDEIYTYQLYCTRAQNKSERQAELKSKFTLSSANSSTASLRAATGSNNLYIKNITETVDDEELKKMFEPFGAITSAKVMRDEKGESRCFGFVCYANPEDASRAVTEMHLKLIGGKPLYVGIHEKKDQRLERLQARFRMPQGTVNQPGMRGPMYGFLALLVWLAQCPVCPKPACSPCSPWTHGSLHDGSPDASAWCPHARWPASHDAARRYGWRHAQAWHDPTRCYGRHETARRSHARPPDARSIPIQHPSP